MVVSTKSLRSPNFGASRTTCACSATIGSPSGDRGPRRCCRTKHDQFRSTIATERGDVALAVGGPPLPVGGNDLRSYARQSAKTIPNGKGMTALLLFKPRGDVRGRRPRKTDSCTAEVFDHEQCRMFLAKARNEPIHPVK